MITALYEWARYIAKKDNIKITSSEFNEAIKKLIDGTCEERDLNFLYFPIQHLFETNLQSREDYIFKIKNDNEHDITPENMKYIMLPKRGLSGKAKQSIGGSIFARNTLKNAVKEAGGTLKDKKVSIPKNSLLKFWRQRLLDTYFQSFQSTEELVGKESICPFCGVIHKFKNLRFNPSVNIFVENVTNFNSYLSNEPSHSICPYCNMLLLRTVIEEKGPQKILFPAVKNAFIYILPYDPGNEKIYEIINKNKVEKFLKEELESEGWKFKELSALNYLLSIPYFIYKNLPYSLTGKIKPSIYVIFADIYRKQAEEIHDYFVVTRFDYLSRVGNLINKYGGIKEIYKFQERLNSYVSKFKAEQKINGYKLLFRFIGKMLMDGKIDFTFLHSILRKEIMDKKREGKNIYIGGYKYLKAFLEAKKEV
ncbi:MAG: hypothetical protein OD816_001121 [Thermodesulfobacterium sp.]|uniref:Type I-B CRISPR-associated protein Cas8b1/Cst1 n=1 Tax=Candidatus Thermodesulfobacterium syntrophicum TaxID=3060442 RepID=A0AAE3TEW1_9BACT|nr:hypothetical protein [Candidatus Thermodesulfobacterium syntrophicum]